DIGAKAIANCALAGVLKPHLDIPVNEVNARPLAQERGIQVAQTLRSTDANFVSSISLKAMTTEGEHSVMGTVFSTHSGPEPRIVRIDRFFLEVVPDGRHLILRNQDRPGVIGAVGTILGNEGINVARMQVGLDKSRAEALQLWNVDAALDRGTLEAIRA